MTAYHLIMTVCHLIALLIYLAGVACLLIHAVPIEPLVFVGYSLVAVALVIELVLALVSFYRASRGNGDR